MAINLSKLTPKDALYMTLRFVSGQGDAVFLAALGICIAGAAFIFFESVYLPVTSSPQVVQEQKPFNTAQFNRVVEQIESGGKRIEERMNSMPGDPFVRE